MNNRRVAGGIRPGGFTLLEALVALALIGSTGLALLAWINQNIDSARRVEELRKRAAIHLEASHFVEGLNPMMASEGRNVLGVVTIEWRAVQKSELARNVIHATNAPGVFELGIFDIDVVASAPGVPEPVRFRQSAVGWKRVVESGALL